LPRGAQPESTAFAEATVVELAPRPSTESLPSAGKHGYQLGLVPVDSRPRTRPDRGRALPDCPGHCAKANNLDRLDARLCERCVLTVPLGRPPEGSQGPHTEILCALATWRGEIDDAGESPREELAFQAQLSDYGRLLREQGGGGASTRHPGAPPAEWLSGLAPS
jgi:hypothetical protein